MPAKTRLTRSQFLVGAAGVAVPARTRAPAPLAALAAAMRGPVLLPGTAAYDRIAPVFNGRYGCLGKTIVQCMPRSEGGTLGHDTFAAGSAYVARTLTSAAAHSLVGIIDARQAVGRSGVLLLDGQGGAIDDAPAALTSFIHRAMRSSVQILSYESGTAAGMASAQGFVDTARAALAPLGYGQAYQNYPDANLKTWRNAYHGSKYADLVALKRERDPHRVLHFP